MAAQLDFYSYDETTKISTALNGTYSLGDIFKGASGIGALRIYNSGTKTAVNPTVSFEAYNNNTSILDWKGLSFSKDYDYDKLSYFQIKYMVYTDGKNTSRVIDTINQIMEEA